MFVSSSRQRVLPKLLIGSVLVLICVGAIAVLSTVFLGPSQGGAAFIDGDGRAETDQVLIFAATPTSSTTTVVPPSTSVPPLETTTSLLAPSSTTSSSTTVLITADPGLHDIPTIVTPPGYEVLDRWSDGPSRVTIWASTDADASRSELESVIAVGLGNWITVEAGELDTSTWAKLIHASHPYCLWVEVYDAGLERRRVEARENLPGQQFVLVESPLCNVQPGSFT